MRAGDLEDLKRLGQELQTVNLPSDVSDLRRIIRRAEQSFKGVYKKDKSRAQFLFVMEDIRRKRVVGASKIFARHGTPNRPHVYFEVREEKVASKTLGIEFKRKFYRLKSDVRGYSEIGGLVLDPHYRGHAEKLGKQLSLIRFLYMKAHPSWFKRRVIAELLPPLPSKSHSTLYDFYGYKLTHIPYRKADLLSYKNKEFILKLFPRSDLYFDILPPQVQAHMEHTGPGSELARHLLVNIGFQYAKQIDPFDGGPYYVARLGDISVYRKSRAFSVAGFAGMGAKQKGLLLMEKRGEVKALLAPFKMKRGRLFVPQELERAWKLQVGQSVLLYAWH